MLRGGGPRERNLARRGHARGDLLVGLVVLLVLLLALVVPGCSSSEAGRQAVLEGALFAFAVVLLVLTLTFLSALFDDWLRRRRHRRRR